MSLLDAKGLVKRYPGVVALDHVDLQFGRGEVHCIVGENGAGKSTLVKILTGLEKPDEGSLVINGHDAIGKPSPAIAYVPQEVNLFDHLTVAENMFLPMTGKALFGRKACEVAARPYMDQLNMEAAPQDLVKNISVAEKQLLQIARALTQQFEVLILDEPTASLTKSEIERLFAIVRQLKAEGKSVIFITHRLDEVMEMHSAVTVLRNGALVGHSGGEDIDEAWIIQKMTGKEIDLDAIYRPRTTPGKTLLEVEGLCGDRFHEISFELREGEVLGFAGLVGAGRSEILQTLFGILPKGAGRARFEGEDWVFGKPARSIAKGVMYLSEERKSHGIFPNLTVRENVGVGLLKSVSQRGVVSAARERDATAEIVRDYRVKTASQTSKIRDLSGGNQQKILIGRSLMAAPKVMIFDEPTRGIDVNAKDEIYRLMQQIAEEQRLGIILISSEIEELIKCSNRVVSIYEGRINAELDESDLSVARILSAVIDADAHAPADGHVLEDENV